MDRKRMADEALSSVAILGLWVQGGSNAALIVVEQELDDHFDAVIALLEEARNERWRLARRE